MQDETITVKTLLEDSSFSMGLTLVAGARGLGNSLIDSVVEKAGLLLAGLSHKDLKNPIIVIGYKEFKFLEESTPEGRAEAVTHLSEIRPATIVVTGGLPVRRYLIDACEQYHVPLFSTPLISSEFIRRVVGLLDERANNFITVHGVLVDVYGLGILIRGMSGVGKSETALDLVVKGHRLVSDDMVELRRKQGRLVGKSPEVTRHYMAIRGIGVIYVPDLFGAASVLEEKVIDLIIKLEHWESDQNESINTIDTEHEEEILGVTVPVVLMPVQPGRSIATLIEVAARVKLLALRGVSQQEKFQRHVNAQMTRAQEEQAQEDSTDDPDELSDEELR